MYPLFRNATITTTRNVKSSKKSGSEIGDSSKTTITITFEIFNVLLQLLLFFVEKKMPITITLAITVDNYNIFLFDIVLNS